MSVQDEVFYRQLDTETRPEIDGPLAPPDLRVPGLTVLYHPDVHRVGEWAALGPWSAGQRRPLSRVEPRFSSPGRSPMRPLGDPHLSRQPVVLEGLENGGVRVHPAPSVTLVVDDQLLGDPLDLSWSDLDQGAVLLLAGRVVLLLHLLDPEPTPGAEDDENADGMIGESAALVRLRREIEKLAELRVPVLVRGETGSGKELVGRALHFASSRRAHPFVAVNLAAIPPSLASAELFGAVKGAYTGAGSRRTGYFLKASGGTLFLDEVGEVPAEVQVLLLRALETHEIIPVGSEQPTRVELRLVAATDADLENAVEEGRFRAPLLHRLSGYQIRVPPLRERRDDLGRLFFHFLREELAELGEERLMEEMGSSEVPWLPAPVFARLARYAWPGNVRQLRNVARQLALGGTESSVVRVPAEIASYLDQQDRERQQRSEPGAAPPAEPSQAASPGTNEPAAKAAPRVEYRSPQDVGPEELIEVLRANQWRLKPAAEQLGISRASLYLLIEGNPNIRKAADLTAGEIGEALDREEGDLDRAAAALEVSKDGLKLRMKNLGMR